VVRIRRGRISVRARTGEFTRRGAEPFNAAIADLTLCHSGHPVLRRHALNTRRPNRWGVSFGKEHRENPCKVDALAAGVTGTDQRSGEVWAFSLDPWTGLVRVP